MIPYVTHRIVYGIPPYMILFWLGWFVGFYVILKESERLQIDRKNVSIIFFSTLFVSPIVGRIFFFWGPWKPFQISWIQFFNFGIDGYVFYGYFIGAAIAILVSSKLLKENIWKILDIFSLAAAIGLFFGRIGCFFAGCCYGKITQSWFSMEYVGKDYSRYPTQLISSFYNLLIFCILSIYKFKKKFDGQITLLYILLYTFSRFIVEFLRYNNWYYLNLSLSQWICALFFFSAIFIYIKKNVSLQKS